MTAPPESESQGYIAAGSLIYHYRVGRGMSQCAPGDVVTIYAENIGGLDTSEVQFTPGVTVLEGRNATGRTSLLTAITGILGGDSPTIKADADEAHIQIEWGENTYRQEFTRDDGEIRRTGESVSNRDDLINLFVSLTESNPARRAIMQGGDLRDIIMRPVDTDAIQRRIEELQSERNRLGQRIRRLEDDLELRPSLESRKQSLKNKLAEQGEEITELQERLEQHDADPEQAEAVEEALGSLEERKQELESIQNRIRTQEDTFEALRDEQSELQTELDALDTSESELDRIETRLSELTSRERSLAATINDLSAIVEFNEDLVSDADSELLSAGDSADSLTATLDPMSETVQCWTCGSDVQRSEIAGRLDELRNVVEEKRQERSEVQSQLDELREKQGELQDQIDRRREITRRLNEIEAEIDRREADIADLKEEREAVRERLGELEEFVAEHESLQESELIEEYQQLSELEYERGQLEEELSTVRENLAELDRLEQERDQLKSQQQEVREDLESQRTQIRDLEENAISAFNKHMEEILGVLDYENITRVWIERKAGTEFEASHGGYRGGSATRFDLHLVRETDDGKAYEDTIDNLSESERNIVGLVVGLAGYLVHDVHEVIPMMLLDSLESIDSERIAALISYFAEFVPYLIVALLPEDADVLADDYAYVPAESLIS
ncbi:archaea-specific SMC-related protein [Halorubrum saccharovorum]|nr:archaea-specific SMC-related protein [Halorubrum saccharovorum]